MKHTNPTVIPVASRYGVMYTEKGDDYDDSKPDRNGFGWFDFEVRGDNHIGVTTGPNADDYSFEIDIKSEDELDVLSGPGISKKTTVSHPSFGDIEQHGEWGIGVEQINWQHNMSTNFWHGGGRWTHYEADPGWPFDLEIDVFASDECYLFPQTPVGMAAFNGSDAYIALDHDITGFDLDFVIDVDVRLNDSSTWWPVFGRAGLGGFIGMDGADLIFGALRKTTTWTPVDDEWFNWRLEFEQPDQLKLQLFINDTLVATSTISRFNTPINRIGVYKQGVGGSLWADGDFKNLKVLLGDYPSTDVELDMPLIENALDAGPSENHGTTFNMDLPSV
jgi:hypothetical protein